MSSMSSGPQGVRFTPSDFKHHGRVALALVPSLLVAASLGGRVVTGILTVGAMIWYLMDAMQLREAALSVVRHGAAVHMPPLLRPCMGACQYMALAQSSLWDSLWA